MSATDELRRTLDERGVEWKEHRHVMPGSMAIQRETLWGQPTDVASGMPIPHVYHYRATEMGDGRLFLEAQLVTPEQAIAATLGREQPVDPVWEQWLEGLRHDEIETIGDAVQQLMYESIEHGGDMGPNGITYDGIDEGEVLTLRFIDDWIEKFKVLQENEEPAERGTCHYEPDYMGFTWWDENDIEHYEENSASDECSSASCDKCGYTMMVGEEGWFDGWDEITEWTEEDGNKHKGYILRPRFKFCPNCGKVVNA